MTLAQLVDWAENAMMVGESEEASVTVLPPFLMHVRIGLICADPAGSC